MPEKENNRRSEWIFAAIVSAAILFLHVYFWLNAGSLWRDEVNLITLSASPSLELMTHDSFPILMPLLVKAWCVFGNSDLWIRFLGMLCGIAIPVAFWIVARMTQRPPIFSLVIFSLNSLMICYGDSLRAYGIGSALIVLSLAAAWSLLKKPTWIRAIILAVVATASVQSLYSNAPLFFSICLGAFVVCWYRRNFSVAVKFFCAGIIAAISLLPYYSHLIELPKAAIELRHGFSQLITSINFETVTGFPFEQFTIVWKILSIIVVGLAAHALIRNKSKNDEKLLTIFAGAILAATTVAFLAFLWFAAVNARPWYFLPPLALAVACFDFGIPLSPVPRLVRVTVYSFLVGVALVSFPAANSELRGHFTNVDTIARQLNRSVAPQDFVIVTPWFCGVSFQRYFESPALWQTLPPLADHSTHRYDLILLQMENTNSLDPIFEKISSTLQSGHRVWVAGMLLKIPNGNKIPPSALLPPPLKNSGWSDTPYSANWSARTMWFLKNHSTKFFNATDADATAPEVFQEKLELFMAEGWKNFEATNDLNL